MLMVMMMMAGLPSVMGSLDDDANFDIDADDDFASTSNNDDIHDIDNTEIEIIPIGRTSYCCCAHCYPHC